VKAKNLKSEYMNFKLRKTYLIFLLIISVIMLSEFNILFCQSRDSEFRFSKNNNDVLIIKVDSTKPGNDNLSNFPFQIGIDIGTGVQNQFYHYGKWGVIGFFDINVYQRMLFFELELGKTQLNNIDGISTYTSLGLKLNIIKFGKHRIIINGGYSAFTKYNSFVPIPIGTIKYQYCISKLLGITASIKFNYGGCYYPFFCIGTQFYTN